MRQLILSARKYHEGICTGMLLSGELNAHPEETDRSAEDMFLPLAEQM